MFFFHIVSQSAGGLLSRRGILWGSRPIEHRRIGPLFSGLPQITLLHPAVRIQRFPVPLVPTLVLPPTSLFR